MQVYTLPVAGTHFISLKEAIAMTSRYNQFHEQLLEPQYRGKNILCTSETYALEDVRALLDEPGCAGFRIYYGMKEDKTIHAILVGTDAAGKDLLPAGSRLLNDDDSLILQQGQRCPPLCPDDSLFNP